MPLRIRRQDAGTSRGSDAGGIRNLEVITADVNEFEPGGRFDRVVSTEVIWRYRGTNHWQVSHYLLEPR